MLTIPYLRLVDLQAAGITYPEVREVPVRPQVEAVRHEIYGACDEDKEAQFVVGEERPFLRSSGVGHLFGKAPLDDGAFRPTKRIAPVVSPGGHPAARKPAFQSSFSLYLRTLAWEWKVRLHIDDGSFATS